MTEHCCENCIFHKIESWYDEEGVEVDYCEMIEWDTKDKNECLRFMPKIQVGKGKPREVEFCLVKNYDKFEFERN